MKKTHIANQSHEMVFSKMNFTSNQQKLLLTLIAQIDSKESHIKPITITLKEMSSLYKKELESRDLKRTLTKINEDFWIETETKYLARRLFEDIEVDKGNSDIKFTFHKHMEEHLLNIKPYVATNIKNIIPLKSVYSIRIYQFLKANLWNAKKNNKKYYVELDYLKEILMTPKSYKDFSLFRTFVLEPAIEQINKETDIQFTYELNKKGKKVIGIEFDIKENIFKSQRIKYEADKAYKGGK